MKPTQKEIEEALILAAQYMAKATADGLMENCALPCSIAFKRIEAIVKRLDK